MTPGSLRVALADPVAVTRSILGRILAGTPGVVLVGEANGADELTTIIRHRRPDVVVVDDRIFRAGPLTPRDAAVRVIVVGVSDDPAYAKRARDRGAHAWLAKERAAELLPALLHPSTGGGDVASGASAPAGGDRGADHRPGPDR